MLVRHKSDREAYGKGIILSRQAPSDEGLASAVWRDKVSDFVIEFYLGDVWEADNIENPENLWEVLWDKAENASAEETMTALGELLTELESILGNEAAEIAENAQAVVSEQVKTAEKRVPACEKGGIYLLTNPAFREYTMLLHSDDIDNTLRHINRTVPFEYEVFAVYRVNNTVDVHSFIGTFLTRIRDTDFYDLSCEKMLQVFKGIAGVSGTMHLLDTKQPDTAVETEKTGECPVSDENTDRGEVSASDGNKNKRKPFSFAECGIDIGSEIEFIDDPSEKAIVATDRKVKYKDKLFSLTALAKELVGTDSSIQGPYYFEYKGVRLTELRGK